MTWWRSVLLLLRRWTVAVPLAALSIGAAAAAYLVTPTPYTAEAVAALSTQTTGTASQGPDRPPVLTNPLLNFDSSLQTAVVILVQSVSTSDVLAEIDADGSNGSSVAISDGSSDVRFLSTNGPFIIFKGTSTTAEGARDVVIRAEQRVRDELLRRQQELNVPIPTYIDLIEVLPVSRAVTSPFEGVEFAGMVLVLVFAAGTGVVYAWHRLRAPGPDTAPDGPDGATGPDDGAELEEATSTVPGYHPDPARPATVASRGSGDEAR